MEYLAGNLVKIGDNESVIAKGINGQVLEIRGPFIGRIHAIDGEQGNLIFVLQGTQNGDEWIELSEEFAQSLPREILDQY